MTRNLFKLQPPATKTKLLDGDKKVAVFDLGKILDEGAANLIANYHKTTVYGIIPKPDLHATRFVVG